MLLFTRLGTQRIHLVDLFRMLLACAVAAMALAWAGSALAANPQVSKQSPLQPQNNSMPVISASFTPAAGGGEIDIRRVSLLLDSVDVVAQATVSSSGISYKPPKPLVEGRHNISLIVGDKNGNFGTANWSFVVDTREPLISAQEPKGVDNADPRSAIGASYTDKGGPIAPANVQILVDGVDVSAAAVKTASSVKYQPPAPLAAGSHTVKLSVTDAAGNTAVDSWSFGVAGGPSGVTIVQLAPAEGSVLAADALPSISAVFQGALNELDLAKTVLLLDDKNVTAQANLHSGGISLKPAAALNEGPHSVKLTLTDKASKKYDASWGFITRSLPLIDQRQPAFTFLAGGSAPLISASYSDVGAGIDAGKIKFLLDGADLTAQASIGANAFSYQVAAPLADGDHEVRLQVADRAGNVLESLWTFTLLSPPQITALSPKDVALPPGSKPTIAAQYQAAGGIELGGVRLFLNKADVTAQAQVRPDGISYIPAQPLRPGQHLVVLEVPGKTQSMAQASWQFEVDAEPSYEITLIKPAAGEVFLLPRGEIVATADASATSPMGLTVNGTDMSLSSEGLGPQYRATLDLKPGVNQLVLEARFADGKTISKTVEAVYEAAPMVSITSPQDRATLGPAVDSSPRDLTGNVERPVTITGSTNRPMQSVTVNQQQATLSGSEYRFEKFFLHEGTNLLTVVATDAHGRTGTASVTVSVDQTAPFLALEAPLNNSVTSANSIDIRGTVNDAVEGYYAAPEPVVNIVNGKRSVSAKVGDKQFLAAGVPLDLGPNQITVRATDEVGNVRSAQINIMRVAAGSSRLTIYGGNGQSGKAGAALPQPLTVAVLDQDGRAVPNTAVTFDISRGTGSLQRGPQGAAARNLQITTDANGLASVWLVLGKQSGPGSNAVHVSAAGIAEDLSFVASGEKGPPKHIRADLGINQYAATGTQPLEPLTAVVSDDQENRISGASVTFSVVAGEARFENGAASITVKTDKNGYAAVRPTLGALAGMTIVKAVPAENGNDFFEATFTLQALEAKEGPTRFSGVVMNDKGQPLPGARMSIGRTALSTTVDEKGRFAFEDVPPGKIDLFVDGRTVTLPGQQYPALHFEATAIKGAQNQLPHPVYLPALEMAEARVVGGDKDVVLKMPGFEGYEMTVFANSVTFPDGSKTGPLVVSPISFDKLPMTPPGGYAGFMAPAATIQPSGTRFDPPVQLKIPNTAGLKPGEKKPVYQWDHDLATFVQMGQATVTEDGAFLITDAGTGISKAGWHPIPNPPPPDDCPGSGGAPSCGPCATAESTGGKCPKQSCKPKPPCRPDPVTTNQMAELPKADLFTSKMKLLLKAIPIVTVAEVNVKGKGVRKLGGECCASVILSCEGPKPYEEVSGEGEVKGELGLGPPIMKERSDDKYLAWGKERWHLKFKLQVAAAKVTLKGNGAVKTKNSKCNNLDCTSISGTASINVSLADVKVTGSLDLEEVVGRPSWDKWQVIIGVGAEATGALKVGGIKGQFTHNSGGAECGKENSLKASWEEVAAEGKIKVTGKIPGLIWPAGALEYEFKYVLMEAQDI
ncbi:Ig-like domain-containing protein [Pseudoduganella violacea]|uniref:Big-1 domain-containing protein n=1 Tax=Pseudoduganella violacea TaxID=1715466 RepID=A0A7W5BG89_9BURK|nr:Ig-like domain-containing protein [Pseudoduganella violacea]MBB3122418.1 hypothetical protein [Pseudoduganella violacea]